MGEGEMGRWGDGEIERYRVSIMNYRSQQPKSKLVSHSLTLSLSHSLTPSPSHPLTSLPIKAVRSRHAKTVKATKVPSKAAPTA